MLDKFRTRYRIPSSRATWHNYDGGIYFTTICTSEQNNYFGKIVNGEIKLTKIGTYATTCIENISDHFPNAEIPLFVIMPNHIHAIVFVDSPDRDAACHVSTLTPTIEKNEKMRGIANKRGQLSTIIGSIKSEISRYANQNNIPFAWQSRFHDRIIRNQDELNRIAEYVENNPIQWESDELNTETQ